MLPDFRRRQAVDGNGASSSTLEPGAVVDRRYLLKRLLARGGTAEVHAAEHLLTHRAVAVKLPLDTSRAASARMRREIEALARARGPGVVELVDAGEVGPVLYAVFDLLEGRTLDGLIAARGQLEIRDTVLLGIDVATALERCHARGVIHRDVKPSNLFVTKRGTVLLDFGIARLDYDGAPADKLTLAQSVLGTPEYMAPESLLGAKDVDQRVDIYALGVTLYECLTGTVPFDGRTADLLRKLGPETRCRVDAVRADVPAPVAEALERSLRASPEARFGSVAEMRAALLACLPDVGVSRPVAPAPAPEWRTRRKHVRAPYLTLARLIRPGGERVDGRVEEVSEGGLQFVGDRAIPEAEVVSLRFALPESGAMVQVTATARWNRTVRGSNATGFQFNDLGETARAEIGRYVAIMSPDG